MKENEGFLVKIEIVSIDYYLFIFPFYAELLYLIYWITKFS